MNNESLQQIIGVDKKNPNFTLSRNPSDPKKLYVFFGAALMEIVSEEKDDPEFKLLIARLYNGGIKRKSLTEAFGVARSTMARWGKSLKSGDPEILLKALSGPGAPLKLTPQVRSFIDVRFFNVYKQTHYNYSILIRKEIKQVFNKKISSETLRPIFNKLKGQIGSRNQNKNKENRANICDSDISAQEKQVSLSYRDSSNNDAVKDLNNRKHSLSFYGLEHSIFCNHAGILIFSSMIKKFKEILKEKGSIMTQWLMTILLGAINIEQTKLLDFDSLQVLFGNLMCRNLNLQRRELLQLTREKPDNVKRLFKHNADITDTLDCRNFYYDPHTKHYTGIKKILKGWVGKFKGVGKIMSLDFIHKSSGEAVFIKHTDNFHDLRERFMKTIIKFRQTTGFSDTQELCFILDRGIYKMSLFEALIKSKNNKFITWEKGYKKDGWDESKVGGRFITQRCRNHSKDFLIYKFEYIEQPWSKNGNIRQIIVRATNPKGRTIEVSILSNSSILSARKIIELIFNRWVQENDFKYLDKHFGTGEITSYAVTSYRKLKEVIEDKQVKSGQYKALQIEKKKTITLLGKLLVKEHTVKKRNNKRKEKIKEFTEQLEAVNKTLLSTDKEVSRLETLIEEQYSRLDMKQKSLMDAIKIIARNMFYKALDPFKQLYDNYRDDHMLFRNLTRSHGCLLFGKEEVKVILFPTVNYPPKTRGIIEAVLEEINQTNPVMPYPPYKKIRLELGKKESKLFAIRIS